MPHTRILDLPATGQTVTSLPPPPLPPEPPKAKSPLMPSLPAAEMLKAVTDFALNSEGLRGPELPSAPAPPGERGLRVAFVGDSFLGVQQVLQELGGRIIDAGEDSPAVVEVNGFVFGGDARDIIGRYDLDAWPVADDTISGRWAGQSQSS